MISGSFGAASWADEGGASEAKRGNFRADCHMKRLCRSEFTSVWQLLNNSCEWLCLSVYFSVRKFVMSVLSSVYLLFFVFSCTDCHAFTCRQVLNTFCDKTPTTVSLNVMFFLRNFNVIQLVAHKLLCVSGEPQVDLHKTESGLEEVVWVLLYIAWNHKVVSLTASILFPCFSLNKFSCVCLYVHCLGDQKNNNQKTD